MSASKVLVPSPLSRQVKTTRCRGMRTALGDTFAETDDTMRGPHLYVLERLGIFRNRLTRDGKGRLTDFPMTDLQKREIDQRMRYCGLLR